MLSNTRRLAGRAMHRLTVREGVRAAGYALFVGLIVSLIATIAMRVFGVGDGWVFAALTPTAFALIGAGVWVWRGRVGAVSAAARVDRALGTKDALASALELEMARRSSGFVALANEEAERIASGAAVGRAIPVRFGWTWSAWPLAAVALIAAMLWFPRLDVLGDDAADAAAEEAQRAAAAAQEQIDEAQQQLEDVGALADDSAALADVERTLDQIEQELSSGAIEPEEASAQTASVLDEIAQDLEEDSQRASMTSDALRDRLSELDTGRMEAAGSTPVDELRDALADGDLDRAVRALEDLESAGQTMSDADRARIAEQLDALAEDLEEQSRQADEAAQLAEEARQEQLSRQGVQPESLEERAPDGGVDETQRALEDEGFTPEAARDLAEQQEQQRREAEAQREAAREAQELSDAARDAAEAQREPSGQDGADEQGSEERRPGESGQEDRTDDGAPDPAQRQTERPGETTQPGESEPRSGEEETPTDEDRQTGGEPGEDRERAEERRSAEESQGDREASDQPGEQESREGQQDGDGERQASQSEGGEPQPSPQQGEQPGETEQRQASEPGGEQQDQQGEQPGGQPEPGAQEGQEGEPSSAGDQQEAREEPGGEGGQPSPPRDAQSQEESGPSASTDGDQASQNPESGQEGQQVEGESTPQPGGAESESSDVPPSDGGARGDTSGGEQAENADVPGDGQSSGESEQPTDGAEGGGASRSDGIERLKRGLERLKDRESQAQQSRDDAEALREQAQDMLDALSPEERRELEEAVREWRESQAQRGSEALPFDASEDVPLSNEEAEVTEGRESRADLPGGAGRGESTTLSPEEQLSLLREAQRSTERATGARGVPRDRAKAVQQFFRRSIEHWERVREAESEGEAASPRRSEQAEDVK